MRSWTEIEKNTGRTERLTPTKATIRRQERTQQKQYNPTNPSHEKYLTLLQPTNIFIFLFTRISVLFQPSARSFLPATNPIFS